MSRYLSEIQLVNDIEALLKEKTKIKDSVVNPQLNWNSRMELYRKVQMINKRIEELTLPNQ